METWRSTWGQLNNFFGFGAGLSSFHPVAVVIVVGFGIGIGMRSSLMRPESPPKPALFEYYHVQSQSSTYFHTQPTSQVA